MPEVPPVEACKVPAFRSMPPVKVLAPDSKSVPVPVLEIAFAEPVVSVIGAEIVMPPVPVTEISLLRAFNRNDIPVPLPPANGAKVKSEVLALLKIRLLAPVPFNWTTPAVAVLAPIVLATVFAMRILMVPR